MKPLARFALGAAVAAVSLVASTAAMADQARPVIDNDYLYSQLYKSSTTYLYRVSGADGPPATPSSGFNLPANVNGANEYYAWWKQEMTDPSPGGMGTLGKWVTAKDHFFTVNGNPSMPFQGNDAEVTIPGSTCAGQRILIAGHNDGTPTSTSMATSWSSNSYTGSLGNMHSGNMGNGSPYDADSGEAMGMAELQALLRWYQANNTWPKRTIKVTLFDAEETGLVGSGAYSSTGAGGLIPDGPQGLFLMVANMDQNGMEYPARHWGTDHYLNNIVGGGVGPWYTNINAAPLVANSQYSSSNAIFGTAAHAAVIAFRAVVAQAVTDAFATLGAKYNFSVPLENPLRLDQIGSTPVNPGTTTIVPAYTTADLNAYSPVVDDGLGRTDQQSFINRGIPGYGIVGAYDSSTSQSVGGNENPYPTNYTTKSTLSQYAGYDTTNDTIANLNFWASGTVHGPDGPASPSEALIRALELPATWTTYTIQNDAYGGSVAAPTTPVAYFETTVVKPRTTLSVTFDATFSRNLAGGTSGLKYYWDFGDGTFSTTGPTVTHTYAAARYADVKLGVLDGNKFGTYRQAVPVNFTPPSASLPAPATNACGTLSAAEESALLHSNDTVPPVTTATVAPPAVNGWYHDPVVTLSATDGTGSGVVSTQYRIDGGAFSLYTSPFAITSQGPHLVEFQSTDLAGNTETLKSIPVNVDTVAPVSSATLSPAAPNGSNGWYTGPVTVTVSAADANSGVASSEVNVDNAGWTPYTAPFPVSGDGPHTVLFRSTDVTGNAESPGGSVSFKIDATAPATTATLTPASPSGAGGWYSGPVQVSLSATDATSGVAGSETNVDGGGWTAYTAPVSVSSNGQHTVQYRSTDNAGNVEAAGSVSFKIDATAPVTTASAACSSPGLDGWCLVASQVTLSAADANSGVANTQYAIDGGSWTTYSGAFTISADGDHTVQFSSTDSAGNPEAVKSIHVKVDQNDPVSTATATPGIHNGWYASPTVKVTATDGSGSGVSFGIARPGIKVAIDGGPLTNYDGSPIGGFTTGNHYIQYQATDNAGRQEALRLFGFKVDAVKPTVTITTPPEGAEYPQDKVVTPQFKCADKESGIDTCKVLDSPTLEREIIGEYAFTVEGTDLAGNVTTLTHHYRVVYTWNGFFSPITNTQDAKLNLVHAGDLIKLGFGLNGDRGLNVFAAGSPTSVPIACPSWTPHLVGAAGAGSSAGLSYGVSSGHYTYGWTTSASWAGTCRRFQIQLNDGTGVRSADFMFFA